MKMSKSALKKLISEFCEVYYCDIYVVFKYAYTEKELEKESYELKRLDLELSGYNDVHVWDTDWDEGQEYIDFFGIYTESDILSLILMPNSIELIKKRLLETAFNSVGDLCDASELLEDIESRIDYWLKGEKNAD